MSSAKKKKKPREDMSVPRKCGTCSYPVRSKDIDGKQGYPAESHRKPNDNEQCDGTGRPTDPMTGITY